MSDKPKPKNKGGRPKQRLSDGSIRYDVPVMCKKIAEYVERNKNGIPHLMEVCLEQDWVYDTVLHLQSQTENIELFHSIKKLHQQRQVNLEKGMLGGKLNPAASIFLLKQPCHGLRDKWDDDTEKKDVPIQKIEIEVLQGVKIEDNTDTTSV